MIDLNSTSIRILAATATFAFFPFLLNGVVVRTKARWAGRKGPPLFQLAWDVLRLLRKDGVRSSASSPVFFLASWGALATSIFAAAIVPSLLRLPVVSFPFDFVVFAYLLGLGRVLLVLAALDTASSFEGMGASREAFFATLVEPALFAVLATVCVLTGDRSLGGLLAAAHSSAPGPLVVIPCAATLFILLQIEAARLPVDDPNTHLELTMIHEVMILDHSGPELAAVQFGAALKMTVFLFLLAGLLNPARTPLGYALGSAGLVVALAVAVGFVESAVARFRMAAVPRFALVALAVALVTLVATTLGANS